MADSIKLSGKNFPIRFDFRALKEFKVLTGNDVLKNFDPNDTDNIIALAYTGLKSGFFLVNPNAVDFPTTIDTVSMLISLSDMKELVRAFIDEVKGTGISSDDLNTDKPGEIPGTA